MLAWIKKLGMDKQFHHTLCWAWDNLSIAAIKVGPCKSKRVPATYERSNIWLRQGQWRNAAEYLYIVQWTSNMRRALVGKWQLLITQMCVELRLSALLQLHLLSRLNTWPQYIEQRQLQDEQTNIEVLGFGLCWRLDDIVYILHEQQKWDKRMCVYKMQSQWAITYHTYGVQGRLCTLRKSFAYFVDLFCSMLIRNNNLLLRVKYSLGKKSVS